MTQGSPHDHTDAPPHHDSPLVGVVMGSDSDLDCMQAAVTALDRFGVPREVRVLSAHRRPDEMLAYGADAAGRGLRVIIAGAGGAAHLPGMLASSTWLPVIGVPVPLRRLDGLDSLLSIVQMPRGVPVATVAIGAAENAALLACRMLAIDDAALATALEAHRHEIRDASRDADARVTAKFNPADGTAT
ncbi:5-(carboxyamino)imidazole ribonucleotide mutase [soil metagenome]